MENAVGKSLMAPLGTGRISFINRKAEAAEKTAYIAKVYEREAEEYMKLNELAVSNGVVMMGSTFAKDIPVGELRQAFELDFNIYNRSFTDLSVFDAEPVLINCVETLAPSKIVLQLGETDLERDHCRIHKCCKGSQEEKPFHRHRYRFRMRDRQRHSAR